LDILLVDPSPPPHGEKGGEPDDSQEVIADLIKLIKQLHPKNRGGKAYNVHQVTLVRGDRGDRGERSTR
jgi:hypothetical protein